MITENEPEWQTHTGVHVTLCVKPESAAAPHAQEALHKAERIVEALRKLLLPEEDGGGETVRVDLTDPQDAPPAASIAVDSERKDAEHLRREVSPECDSGICTISYKNPDAPLALALTRCLINRWFGEHAGMATAFLEGIAGLAAANAGVGPALEEADAWVRAELEAGHKVSALAHRKQKEQAKQAEQPSERVWNFAAVSFLGFLAANSSPKALNRYLVAFDPDRQDQAANTAYHHPLAVLEEEWQSRLHRRANSGDMFRSFVRQIMPLLKPYKWKQVEILVYLLLAAAYNVVQPYAIKIVIDRLTKQVQNGAAAAPTTVFMQVLAPFLLLLLGIYVLNGLVSLRRAYTVNWLNQNVLNTLQVQMYAHMQRLAHNFYLKAKIGDLMARLNDDLDNVQSALAQVTNKALYQSFTLVGAVTALCLLTRKSPTMAIPILCIIPLFAINYAALRSRNKQASREQRRRVGQAMADVQQHLSAHALIKAFRLEERTLANYRSRVKALQRSKLRLALLSALTDLSEDMTTALAQLVIFGVGGYLVIRDGNRGLGVGDLSALLVLVKSIFSPIASLAGIGQTMQQATGAMERVSELFNEPVTISDKPDAKTLPPLARDIRLEHVDFRYGGDRPALKDFSITIPAGKHVALVGFSGSGKSSTVNLLLRFWDPEEGHVLFDGQDLRDITLASLRDQIGLVFQETFIFDTTLRENIAIGRPDATDVEIREAAKAAQLDRFIESLPDGYDTIPGENGSRLSVGQKQRIAIARAYLRNPRILILDEATSALDTKTEAGVLETIGELAKGRTTISVTHRIAQAANADLIFVLDTGRLAEQGTHADLIKAGGLYQKLYEEATGFATQNAPPLVAVERAGKIFSENR